MPKEQIRSLAPSSVDEALREEWKKAGLVPAARADDATFLRRVYIDVVGTIPPPEVTAKFLTDTDKDKRAKVIESLLASSEYQDHWTNYWDDVLMGREARSNLVDRTAFRLWLRARFAANAPWNSIVSDVIAATGQNGDGNPRIKGSAMQVTRGSMGSPAGDAKEDDDDAASGSVGSASAVNGAVNWTLRFEKNPQDIGGTASRIFLGVQIQCAQCHDHKTEAWKQEDFRRFSNAFFHVRVEPIDKGKPMGGLVKRALLNDFANVAPRFTKGAELQPIARAKATALDGTSLDKGLGTRKALAGWMTSKDNKWFTKAFVNRMWGHFLGRGFYDPVDDIRASNPGNATTLLDQIAADFVAHDFDIKHLIRLICATEAYQLAAAGKPGDPNANPNAKAGEAKAGDENKLWAHFHLVPLGPEELLNGILRATAVERTAQRAGIKDIDALRMQVVKQYAFLFDTDEEDDEPDYSGTVTQALALLNGTLVNQSARALPGSVTLDTVNGPGTDADKVDALTMRVLSRHATADEKDRWVKYIEGADARAADAAKSPTPATKSAGKADPLRRLSNKRAPTSPKQAAYEDLLWSFLNSSEFTFNH